jgi:hypothetical protein
VSNLILTDDLKGTITRPGEDGTPVTEAIPTRAFTKDEAATFRDYKKLLAKYNLVESIYCRACFTGNRHDGTEAYVTDTEIAVICRCTQRVYFGSTY